MYCSNLNMWLTTGTKWNERNVRTWFAVVFLNFSCRSENTVYHLVKILDAIHIHLYMCLLHSIYIRWIAKHVLLNVCIAKHIDVSSNSNKEYTYVICIPFSPIMTSIWTWASFVRTLKWVKKKINATQQDKTSERLLVLIMIIYE